MADVELQPQQIENLGQADIVLGVFSHDSAGTITHVVRAAQEALATSFPNNRSVLVNIDADSKDGTRELAAEAALDRNSFVQLPHPVPRLALDPYGIFNRAGAYQALFGAVGKLSARATAVIDGNVSSFAGNWVEALVRPVVEGEYDLVSACYLRHKYEGPIINGIVYPLTRALYGKRIRQPIGGEFGFSGKLIEHLMRQPESDGNTVGFGMEAWISTRAVCGDFRLAQTFLGPRVLNSNEPPPDVSTTLANVLGPIFSEMSQTAPAWQRIRHSEMVPTFGDGCDTVAESEPESAPVDFNGMIDSFRLGYENLQDIWRIVLSPGALVELKRMAARSADTFRFEDTLWARVIYDFALAHRLRTIDRNHLLRALTPIYLGWVAGYGLGVRDKNAKETQDRIEALCLAYEAQKSYLISRWRWPDRFNP